MRWLSYRAPTSVSQPVWYWRFGSESAHRSTSLQSWVLYLRQWTRLSVRTEMSPAIVWTCLQRPLSSRGSRPPIILYSPNTSKTSKKWLNANSDIFLGYLEIYDLVLLLSNERQCFCANISVLWTVDQTSFITCRCLPGFYTGTNLYWLVTEAQGCEQLAQGCCAAVSTARVGVEPAISRSLIRRFRCCTIASQTAKIWPLFSPCFSTISQLKGKCLDTNTKWANERTALEIVKGPNVVPKLRELWSTNAENRKSAYGHSMFFQYFKT